MSSQKFSKFQNFEKNWILTCLINIPKKQRKKIEKDFAKNENKNATTNNERIKNNLQRYVDNEKLNSTLTDEEKFLLFIGDKNLSGSIEKTPDTQDFKRKNKT